MAQKSPLKSLQDRDAAITAEMRKMSDLLATENRVEFTEDEEGKFDQLKAESAAVQKRIGVEQSILDSEKRLAKVTTDANQATAKELEERGGKTEEDLKPKFPAVVTRSYNLHHFAGEGRSTREWNELAYQSGRFFLAACWKHQPSIDWCNSHGLSMGGYEFLAQSSSVNTAGGILIPDVLSDRIIDLKEKRGIFAQNADRWPMSSDNLTIPRRTSGVTPYFVSDGVATTESQAGWDGVTLSAKELAALVRYPIALNEDAIISMADKLTGEIAYAFADMEDQCGFNGTGSAAYGGMRGLSVLINDADHGNSTTTNGATAGGMVIAAAGGTSFGATVLADYERMVGLLPEYASENAKWYFSRAGFAAGPQRLMDAAGGNTNLTLANGRPGNQFLGYPVVTSQVLNSTLSAQASTVVAFLGDLALASSYGSRREIGISSSMDRYFEYRQIAIQGVERFDIVNHDLGNTSTAGPVVALKLSAT